MAVTLDSVIRSLFQGNYSHSRIMEHRYRNLPTDAVTSTVFMEIPVRSEVIEMPVFAFDDFINIGKRVLSVDTMVAQLYSNDIQSEYKSLDSIMKDCLSTKFSKHLTVVSVPNAVSTYYCTYGAVFNSNFKPLMMMSWLMERRCDDDGREKYYYKRPLLRINPDVYMNKEDAVQRFIVNKLIVNSLYCSFYTPYYPNVDSFLNQNSRMSERDSWKVKVEIDECPFVIRRPDIPSISISNKDLLQIAADHIDEILQK